MNAMQFEEEYLRKLSSYQKLKLQLEKSNKDFDEIKKLANDYLSKLQWTQAELENLRKTNEREKESYIKYAVERLIIKILPVIDDFEIMLNNPHNINIDPKILEGMKIVYNKLCKALESEGLTTIEARGEKFDPYKHEAVMQIIDNSREDSTVVEVLQRGYMLNLKVIRASKVKVSKRGDKNDKGI